MRHTLRPVLFKVWRSLFVVGATAALGSTGMAAPLPLNPGTTQYNPVLAGPFPFFSNFYQSGPLPANYVLVTTANVPYDYNGTSNNAFSGFVTTSVYRKTTDSTLAFTYVFNNLAPFPGAPLTDIVRATINDPTDPWSFNQVTGLPFQITAAGADPNSGGHSTPINGFFGGWNNGLPFDITRRRERFWRCGGIQPVEFRHPTGLDPKRSIGPDLVHDRREALCAHQREFFEQRAGRHGTSVRA